MSTNDSDDRRMTAAERERFAALVTTLRERKFVTVAAAVRASGISMEAWRSTERGESKAPRTLRRVVGALWDDADGRWERALEIGDPSETEPAPPVALPTAFERQLLARISRLEAAVFGDARPTAYRDEESIALASVALEEGEASEVPPDQ